MAYLLTTSLANYLVVPGLAKGIYRDVFIGTTAFGGSNEGGVIFEFDPADNGYSVRQHLNGVTGKVPTGKLASKDGKFYGTTGRGGTNDGGVIFEWNLLYDRIHRTKLFCQIVQSQV